MLLTEMPTALRQVRTAHGAPLPAPGVPDSRVHVLEIVGNGIVGGMETVVSRLIAQLPAARFRVSVLCPYEGPYSERLRRLGVPCMAIAMPDDPPWVALHSVAALIRSRQVDVLHAHLTNAHVLAGLAGAMTETPVLATVHGRQLTLLDVEVHRSARTHLHAVCRHTELHALGLGIDARRLHCIPNGVDSDLFSPHSAHPAANEVLAAAAPGTFTVGFVGRLSAEKAPEDFVRAALALRRRMPQLRFVMIGEGPMAAMLENLLRRHRLAGWVHLAGVQKDMPAIYRQLDLLVSTSHSEAMPLAIMEAMASGLPVVATRVGGVPDLVVHGQTGLLCEPGRIDAIAAAIAQMADHCGASRAMGARGRERMLQHFSLARSVEATGALLMRLAQSAADARPGLSWHAADGPQSLALTPA